MLVASNNKRGHEQQNPGESPGVSSDPAGTGEAALVSESVAGTPVEDAALQSAASSTGKRSQLGDTAPLPPLALLEHPLAAAPCSCCQSQPAFLTTGQISGCLGHHSRPTDLSRAPEWLSRTASYAVTSPSRLPAAASLKQ